MGGDREKEDGGGGERMGRGSILRAQEVGDCGRKQFISKICKHARSPEVMCV